MPPKKINKPTTKAEPIVVRVGEPYPEPMAPGVININMGIDQQGNGLITDFGLPEAHSEVFESFRRGPKIRVFHEERLPEGLLMLGLESESGHLEGIYAVAFDPKTIWEREPHRIADFLDSENPWIRAALVNTNDPEQRVLFAIACPMPARMLACLAECWKAPNFGPSSYKERLNKLLDANTLLDLWESASQFME